MLLTHRKKLIRILVFCAIMFPIVRLIIELVSRVRYEFMLPYSEDSGIYWCVARGIINSFVPYKDLFESKPPGIFLLLATILHFHLPKQIVYTLETGLILFISSTPLLYTLSKPTLRTKMHIVLFSLFSGTLIGLYSAERGGELQVELFGAGLLCAYILILTFYRQRMPLRDKTLHILLLSLFLLLSVGFKEPFILTALAITLLFSSHFMMFVETFMIPATLAGCAGLLLLWTRGLFHSFFVTYLPFILHVRIYGAPFLDWHLLYQTGGNLEAFAPFLGVFLLFLYIDFSVVHIQKYRSSYSALLFTICKIVFVLLLPLYILSLSAGAGEFFNHHYVFISPLFVGLIIHYIDAHGVKNTNNFVVLLVCMSASILFMPHINYEARISWLDKSEKPIRREAEYVDRVLDLLGKGRYLYLGVNGTQIYGYTKHSPYGPVFVQLPIYEQSPELMRNTLKNIYVTPLIVYDRTALPHVGQQLMGYINTQFTTVPPKTVKDIPRLANIYVVLFRKQISF